MVKPAERYVNTCHKTPQISIEAFDESRKGTKVIVDTERFTVTSLYTAQNNFSDYTDDVQGLYKATLGNSKAIEKFGESKPWSPEQYSKMITRSSQRWEFGNGLGAYIVTNNEEDDEKGIVGWMNLGDGDDDRIGTAEVAYVFNPEYSRSGNKNFANVGYECVGALLIHHVPENLYNKTMVHQNFDDSVSKYTGGEKLEKICATAREDNPGSWKILQNCGFMREQEVVKKFNDDTARYQYERDYSVPESEIVELSGLIYLENID